MIVDSDSAKVVEGEVEANASFACFLDGLEDLDALAGDLGTCNRIRSLPQRVSIAASR